MGHSCHFGRALTHGGNGLGRFRSLENGASGYQDACSGLLDGFCILRADSSVHLNGNLLPAEAVQFFPDGGDAL